MRTAREQTLHKELKKLDHDRVKFHDARQQLLARGYTEKEIARATYGLSYDAQSDKPKEPHPASEYLKKNPLAAKKLAEAIIEVENEKERTRMRGLRLGARFAPGLHARAHYQSKLAAESGFPYLTFTLLGGLWALVAIFQFQLDELYVYLGLFAIALIFELKAKLFG